MPKIHVHTPFTLTHDDGSKQDFASGEHEVDEAVAGHWYVKHHSGAKPGSGAPAAVTSALASSDVAKDRQTELDAREDALQKLKALVTEREEALRAREAELDAREDAIAVREAAIAVAAEGQGSDAGAEQTKAQQHQGKKK